MDILEVKQLYDQIEGKMSKAVGALSDEFQKMKAGRANPHILDKIKVDYYGTETPINQVGNISVPEARMIVISCWDIKALKDVEKAIIAANIGVSPNNDGKVIRLIFPELTQESRKNLVKEIKTLAENARVVLRNVRRDAIDTLKRFKKDNILTEDDLSNGEKDVDKKLSRYTGEVDKLAKDKEAEVLSV